VVPAFCQTNPPFIGMGDSLGEGDQSYNASTVSQPNDYLNLIAAQMGVPFQQPLINSTSLGIVGSPSGRSRVNPNANPTDLAVSGATTLDLVSEVASTNIQHEIDLVLAPYIGESQLKIAEELKPKTIFLWIGNDDLIGYILDFSHLQTPNVTSLADFTAAYEEMIAGLKTTNAQVVLANIPDITELGYLFDNDELTFYTGTNYNLPAGYYTTFPTMALLKLGVYDASYLQNPDYVLSPSQITNIQSQITQYNAVISEVAGGASYPVVDALSVLQGVYNTPVVIEGITVSASYNGGVFSLDGIHPSDTGYCIFANSFIKRYNEHYTTSPPIPEIPFDNEVQIMLADPFIDFDGSGVVQGRPDTGLLETVGPLIGVSGNKNNKPGIKADSSVRASKPADAAAFMRAYYTATGRDPETKWTKADVVNVFKEIFHVE
jgi:lysophospholipase L1-like esterase